MATPRKRQNPKSAGPDQTQTGSASGGATPPAKVETSITPEAADHFVKGVLVREEAAPADANGNVPADATHEIVGTDAQGQPTIQRRKFKFA